MIDHWFGRVLDEFDGQNLWDDTALVVCTDHGLFLGEVRNGRDIWGKPGVPQYEPMGHTPLMIHWPGTPGGSTCDALTTNVDLFATIADVFGVGVDHLTHGKSISLLLDGESDSIREWALGGVYGNWVQINDGTRKYARSAVGDNFPLSMWSNRWSTMPLRVAGLAGLPNPDDRAWLDHMPGSEIPVIRQPFQPGDMLPFAATGGHVDDHYLFDLSVDPGELENRVGESAELEMIDLLHTALGELSDPADQFARLGLS